MFLKISSIELSYLFAKNLQHGINNKGDWQLFEPSKFIYSFFAFNMIYEINWKITLSTNRLRDQRRLRTHTKIYELIEFLYSSNNLKNFKSTFEKFGSIDNLINNARLIKPDSSINGINNCPKLNFENKNSFLNNYKSSIDKLKNYNFKKIDHYHLLAFTYQIRNNIFHGSKTVGIMTLKEQRERLTDYTNIILTTLEQFFNILENNHSYYRAEAHELNENINFTSN